MPSASGGKTQERQTERHSLQQTGQMHNGPMPDNSNINELQCVYIYIYQAGVLISKLDGSLLRKYNTGKTCHLHVPW